MEADAGLPAAHVCSAHSMHIMTWSAMVAAVHRLPSAAAVERSARATAAMAMGATFCSTHRQRTTSPEGSS